MGPPRTAICSSANFSYTQFLNKDTSLLTHKEDISFTHQIHTSASQNWNQIKEIAIYNSDGPILNRSVQHWNRYHNVPLSLKFVYRIRIFYSENLMILKWIMRFWNARAIVWEIGLETKCAVAIIAFRKVRARWVLVINSTNCDLKNK